MTTPATSNLTGPIDMAIIRNITWALCGVLCATFDPRSAVSSATHVVLLDTTTATSLDWTKFPDGPQSRTPGWVEESFTDFHKGINWRSYVVCDVAYDSVNNWLWTPFVERQNASRIYIEVQFSMRDCSLFPGMALSCKETFSLLYYEVDDGEHDTPPWEPESYKLVDRIAADKGRFTSTNEVIINTETRSIPVTKRGVYFALRDEGACLSLIALRVYYITCPNVTLNHAFFPETPTASDITSIVARDGECVPNAQMIENPRLVCKGDGEWTLPTGGCKCRPGFEPDGNECKACPPSTYKAGVGDDVCSPCPRHSIAVGVASAECACVEGFFRSASDPVSMACTQPPLAPQNLTCAFVDQSSVILVWRPPNDDGGRRDTTYRVRCDACGAQTLFTPASAGFNETRVTVSGLSAATRYRFEVFAENGVTPLAGDDRRRAEIFVRTEPPPVVHRITRVFARLLRGSNELLLSWEPPVRGISPASAVGEAAVGVADSDVSALAGSITGGKATAANAASGNSGITRSSAGGERYAGERSAVYEVRYFPRKFAKNETIVFTNATQLSIGNLLPRTEYGFQVRLRSPRAEFSDPLYRTTDTRSLLHASGTLSAAAAAGGASLAGSAAAGGAGMGHSGLRSPSEAAAAASAAGQITIIVVLATAILLVVAALIAGFLYVRRNSEECNKKQPSDCDTLEYRNGEGKKIMDHGPLVQTAPLFTTPLFANCGALSGSRLYIDPHTYEDPQQAVREFTREIDRDAITIECVIGQGEFADVCRGLLRPTRAGDGRPVPVAVKTLKAAGGASEKARNDFLTEATIMGQFDHPNVIYLEGVVTRGTPVMIVTELMENGSLDQFLRDNAGQLNIIELVAMLHGIASGMQYLANMNFVHRDLAARNVLVNAELVCKIADFGLSREIEYSTYAGNGEGEYRTSGGKIPVRWTAPEGIQYRIFTTASDVWSFGIVCWEVLSAGERPYYNWLNQEVIQRVDAGYRLPPPRDCPEPLHMLMLDCWRSDRSLRPSFACIVATLESMLKQPGTLRRLATGAHQPQVGSTNNGNIGSGTSSNSANNNNNNNAAAGGGSVAGTVGQLSGRHLQRAQQQQHSSTLQLNSLAAAGGGVCPPHSGLQHLQLHHHPQQRASQQQSAIYGCTPNSVSLGGGHSSAQLHHNAANARSVEEWLTLIKMSRYLDHFLRGGFTTLDSVAHMRQSDLNRIGVVLVGHQKKILDNIKLLNDSISAMYGNATGTGASSNAVANSQLRSSQQSQHHHGNLHHANEIVITNRTRDVSGPKTSSAGHDGFLV